MADWERALDKQLATYLWWNSDAAIAPSQAWIADVNQKYASADSVERFIAEHRSLLWLADPIWVTPDMANLLEASYPEFEPEPLRDEDLIVRAGFALLPRAFYIPDVWGKQTAVRAIAWRHIIVKDKPGVSVSLFCNADDTDDYAKDEDRAGMRRLYGDAMSLVATTGYVFGETFEERMNQILLRRLDLDIIDRTTAMNAGFHEIRLLQAFWRMTRQQIAVGFQQRPSRAQRHRSERSDYPEKYITVVTLRRPRSASGNEPHAVDWKVRWVVSGHWHWYNYKDGSRRQLWISDYVKGPEDAPLAIRKLRVFQWSR